MTTIEPPVTDRFYVGSTVRMIVRVSHPITDDPMLVTSVALTSLSSVVLTPPRPFAANDDLVYEYLLDTSGMTSGSHHWSARIEESGVGVTIVEDAFVLLDSEAEVNTS